MLLIICVERLLHIANWQPLFSKKMAAAASFSYKIGGGGLVFLQNWRQRPHFPSYKIGGWPRRRQGFGNITGGCSDMVWILDLHPECSTWHKFPKPGGAISTKKYPISNPGTRGHNFD